MTSLLQCLGYCEAACRWILFNDGALLLHACTLHTGKLSVTPSYGRVQRRNSGRRVLVRRGGVSVGWLWHFHHDRITVGDDAMSLRDRNLQKVVRAAPLDDDDWRLKVIVDLQTDNWSMSAASKALISAGLLQSATEGWRSRGRLRSAHGHRACDPLAAETAGER